MKKVALIAVLSFASACSPEAPEADVKPVQVAQPTRVKRKSARKPKRQVVAPSFKPGTYTGTMQCYEDHILVVAGERTTERKQSESQVSFHFNSNGILMVGKKELSNSTEGSANIKAASHTSTHVEYVVVIDLGGSDEIMEAHKLDLRADGTIDYERRLIIILGRTQGNTGVATGNDSKCTGRLKRN